MKGTWMICVGGGGLRKGRCLTVNEEQRMCVWVCSVPLLQTVFWGVCLLTCSGRVVHLHQTPQQRRDQTPVHVVSLGVLIASPIPDVCCTWTHYQNVTCAQRCHFNSRQSFRGCSKVCSDSVVFPTSAAPTAQPFTLFRAPHAHPAHLRLRTNLRQLQWNLRLWDHCHHRPTPQMRRRSYCNLCCESSARVMYTGLSPVVPLQENFRNFKPEDVAANGISMRRDE